MFDPVQLPWMNSQLEHLHSKYFNDNCFMLQCQTSFKHSFIHSFITYFTCGVMLESKKLEVVQARGLVLYYSLINY